MTKPLPKRLDKRMVRKGRPPKKQQESLANAAGSTQYAWGGDSDSSDQDDICHSGDGRRGRKRKAHTDNIEDYDEDDDVDDVEEDDSFPIRYPRDFPVYPSRNNVALVGQEETVADDDPNFPEYDFPVFESMSMRASMNMDQLLDGIEGDSVDCSRQPPISSQSSVAGSQGSRLSQEAARPPPIASPPPPVPSAAGDKHTTKQTKSSKVTPPCRWFQITLNHVPISRRAEIRDYFEYKVVGRQELVIGWERHEDTLDQYHVHIYLTLKEFISGNKLRYQIKSNLFPRCLRSKKRRRADGEETPVGGIAAATVVRADGEDFHHFSGSSQPLSPPPPSPTALSSSPPPPAPEMVEAEPSIHISRLLSKRRRDASTKYCTKEDRDAVAINVYSSRLHFFYQLEDYARTHLEFRPHDAFVVRHYTKYRFVALFHESRRREMESEEKQDRWARRLADFQRRHRLKEGGNWLRRLSTWLASLHASPATADDWDLNVSEHCLYVYGRPGIGKSYAIEMLLHRELQNAFQPHLKSDRFAFSGLSRTSSALYMPDCEPRLMWSQFRESFLRLSEGRTIVYDVKGEGLREISLTKPVILVSNFPSPQDEAFLRRFTIIHADTDWTDCVESLDATCAAIAGSEAPAVARANDSGLRGMDLQPLNSPRTPNLVISLSSDEEGYSPLPSYPPNQMHYAALKEERWRRRQGQLVETSDLRVECADRCRPRQTALVLPSETTRVPSASASVASWSSHLGDESANHSRHTPPSSPPPPSPLSPPPPPANRTSSVDNFRVFRPSLQSLESSRADRLRRLYQSMRNSPYELRDDITFPDFRPRLLMDCLPRRLPLPGSSPQPSTSRGIVASTPTPTSHRSCGECDGVRTLSGDDFIVRESDEDDWSDRQQM